MSINYNKILCESIKTIVSSEIQKINFDKTIVATIVDDSKKKDGCFLVSDGTTKFNAYTNDNLEQYALKDQVYVTIPQGDFSRQKIILSKYTNDNKDIPISYVSPLESMVDMTNNILSSKISSSNFSILANGETQAVKICSINLTELLDNKTSDNALYDTLGIKADFCCNIPNMSVRKGHYGLRLDLFMNDIDKPEQYISKSIYLDSDQMFGNLYNSDLFLTQCLKVDISKLPNIWGINIYLYQTSDFFYWDDKNNQLKEVPSFFMIQNEQNNKEKCYFQDNIKCKNIGLSFGNDLLKIPDDTFKISTKDTNKYSIINKDINKTIYSSWYNKTEDGIFIGFEDGIVDQSYDEDSYKKEYEDNFSKGFFSSSTLSEAERDRIPNVKESLCLYGYGKEIDKLCISYDTNSQTPLNDLYSSIGTLKKILTEADVSKEALTAIDNFSLTIENFSQDIQKVGNNKNDPQTVFGLDKQWLYQYKRIYEVLCGRDDPETPETPIDITKPPENYFQNIEDLNKNVNISFNIMNNTGKDLFENILPKYILNQESLNLIVPRHKEICRQSIEKINTYFIKVLDTLKVQSQEQRKKLQARFFEEQLTVEQKTKTFLEEYNEFEKKYKNRYCIYWYLFNVAYKEEDPYLGLHWKRLESPKDGNGEIIYPTPGMPDIIKDNKYSKSSNTPFLNIKMDENNSLTSVKALLFYNHKPYQSNLLTFENLDKELDASVGELTNSTSIELDENALNNYHMYDVNNYLINPVNANLKRYIRIRYNDGKELDEGLINTYAFWYIPISATMIKFDNEALIAEGFTNLDTFLNAHKDETYYEDLKSYQKVNYICFFKLITQDQIINDKKQVKIEDTKFFYFIKDTYISSFTNNEILCTIVKNKQNYTTQRQFLFNSFGTNGTDYGLALNAATSQSSVIYYEEKQEPMLVKATLTDSNGNEIPKESLPPITFSFIQPNKNNLEILNTDNDYEKNIAGAIFSDNMSCYYNVLSCSINWKINEQIEHNTLLTSFLPIPYSVGHYYMEGPSTVIYDDFGKNPSYYQGGFKLYDSNTRKEIIDEPEKNISISWEMYYYDSQGKRTTFSDNVHGYDYVPKIKHYTKNSDNYKEGWYLEPLPMYISGETDRDSFYSVAVCFKNENGVSTLLWAQPILIMQNKFNCPMINKWDNSLTIDKNNGIILSTMMGAGKKDNQNRFSGILMGEVKTNSFSSAQTGLYGYYKGTQSFGFKEDGTAFLGASDLGRIEFNGEKGTITSGNYYLSDKTEGMSIDLKNGHIDAFDFLLTSHNLILDSTGSNKNGYYFCLLNNEDNLENPPYLALKKNGDFLINTKNCILNNYGLTIKNGRISNEKLEIYNDGSIVSNDGAFKVDKDGHLFANSAKINGTIENNRLFIDADGVIVSNGGAFRVDEYGHLTATSAQINGTITNGELVISEEGTIKLKNRNFEIASDGHLTAKYGTIGGWEFCNNGEENYSEQSFSKVGIETGGDHNSFIGIYANYPGPEGYRIVIGNQDKATHEKTFNFTVNKWGTMYCSGASISGATISKATISNATISGGTLTLGNTTLKASDTDLLIDGNVLVGIGHTLHCSSISPSGGGLWGINSSGNIKGQAISGNSLTISGNVSCSSLSLSGKSLYQGHLRISDGLLLTFKDGLLLAKYE